MNRLLGVSALVLAGLFGPDWTWEVLEEEIGRTVADVTLVAGMPHSVADLPDGRRAFRWQRWALDPRGGPRCLFTLYAEREGRPESLAAWRVVEIEPPTPECGPPPEKKGLL